MASPLLSDGTTVYTPGISERPVNGATSYYLLDALGSVVASVNGSQQLSSDQRFDAFGNKGWYIPFGSTFGYAAKAQYQTDGESGLLLLGHRYYDPSVGRFISQDPARSSWNLYAYCGNNPLGTTDPTGLFAPEASTPAGAGMVGGRVHGELTGEERLQKANAQAQTFMRSLVQASMGAVIFPWNALWPYTPQGLVAAGISSTRWAVILAEMTGVEWGGTIDEKSYEGAMYYQPSAPFIGDYARVPGHNEGLMNFAGHYTDATVATYHSHPRTNIFFNKNAVPLLQINSADKGLGEAHNWVMFVGNIYTTYIYYPETGTTVRHDH